LTVQYARILDMTSTEDDGTNGSNDGMDLEE